MGKAKHKQKASSKSPPPKAVMKTVKSSAAIIPAVKKLVVHLTLQRGHMGTYNPPSLEGIHPQEMARTGCDGGIEGMKCKCKLAYTKLSTIKIDPAIYNRDHNGVTPAYTSDGRYQCDGCANFFHCRSKAQTVCISKVSVDILKQTRLLQGWAFHCPHGFDFCPMCVANSVPPKQNMPV